MSDGQHIKGGDAAVRKAVALFIDLAREGNTQTLTQLAKARAIAPSTAYRLVQPFLNAGLLARPKRQSYLPGLTLHDLANLAPRERILAGIARPHVDALSKALGIAVHLGVWQEDMVTYIVKAAPLGSDIFTQEGMQLEAYCSGIGKVLLAHKSAAAQQAYLANGPFVALTQKTVTDPGIMRKDWQMIREQGYAEDVEEISEGLRCFAVPLFGPKGTAIAALSVSSRRIAPHTEDTIRKVEDAAASIGAAAYGAVYPTF